ncbi:MAG: ComEC/Rec2 family competence protein [Elusimicrobiota bacterium]
MPLSYFKRPLALLAVGLILTLSALKARGFFAIPVPVHMAGFLYKPVRVQARVVSGFSPKQAGDRYWMRAFRTEGIQHPETLLMVYLARKERPRPGQVVLLRGKLRRPLWPRNPGGFDEGAFLEERGAALVLHAYKAEVLSERVPWRWLPWAWGDSVHRSIHAYFEEGFDKDTAGVLEGLLVGFKGRLSRGLNRAIQDSGTMHLVAPSGAKVAFILAAALWLCGRLKPLHRWMAAGFAGALYLLVVGPEPPYVRAYVMFMTLFAAHLSERESGAFQGLVLSVLLMLAAEPRCLFTAGFVLTTLAMLGILVALPRWKVPGAWSPLVRIPLSALTVSFVVQLMLWPAFAHYFGRGSVAGLAANALAVPASWPIMAAGSLAWLSSCLPAVQPVLAWIAAAGAGVFIRLCAFFAVLPGAAVDIAPMAPQWIAAYYLAALGILALPRWRVSAACLGCAGAFALVAILARSARTRVVFLSDPKRSSVIVTFPDGRSVLKGAGVPPSVLKAALRDLGISRLERTWPAEGGLELRHGGFLLSVGEGWARVRTAEKGEYCIMAASTETRPRRCLPSRTFSTRWDGAVTVRSDGEDFHIESQRERYTFGRDFP